MELIRGISGIRGIAGKTLTNRVLSNHIQAFSKIQDNGEILLARDSRIHGEKFINEACQTLQKCGRTIHNFNIIPTPTAQFLVDKQKFAGGIVITASHNPKEWNGLKFIDSDGCFLDYNKNMHLFEIADNIILKEKKLGEIITINTGYATHVKHTLNLSAVNSKAIIKRNFNVVVDAVNGAASKALPAMLEALGCTVHLLHCNPDGQFPRGTEPIPKNLTILSDTVIANNADIGFATDPDGDRLAIIDENGNPLGEEYTLALCMDGFLKSTKSTEPIVTNLSSSLAIDRVAKKYGNSVIRTAVGEINVVNKMKDCHALLGGEGNGGVILSESHYGRDSLVGVSLILNKMIQDKKPISKIYQSMPQYVMSKDKIKLININVINAFKKIRSQFSDAQHNTMDGLKIIWEDSWLHCRKSNTEPIMRIYAEAPTKLEVEMLINKVKSIL